MHIAGLNTNQNLKYDFQDSYSRILYRLHSLLSFHFSSMKTLFMIENSALQREKTPFPTTILPFY